MTIRLYCENIKIGEKISLNEVQCHYLHKVMRRGVGNLINIFNKNDGECECKIVEISAKKCVILPEVLVKSYVQSRQVVCVFSLIKQKNIELIIQKCTEIGVFRFIPLKTERSSSENINIPRLNGIAIEASEQCGRLDIPEISSPITINELEKMQGQGRVFILLNQNGTEFQKIQHNSDEIYIISGPEGGFTENEINQLASFSKKVKISQNILRAETATILGCGLYFL